MAKETKSENKTETTTETKTDAKLVKKAYLHASVIMASKTETLLDQLRFPGIKMELAPSGLFITIKGERHFIPAANIKNCVLE